MKDIKIKLTELEHETLLRILSSVTVCFKNASFNETLQAYTDDGNFVCCLDKEQVESLKKIYNKI